MLKKIKRFFKKRSWLLLLFACLVFIPQSFNYQSKLNMRVLVSGIAIDKAESGYEVTAQVIMPTPGSESGGSGARLDFISEKGDSIAEGIQKIAYKIGKTAGLSHTSFVMVGDSMLEENLASSLDYFARDAKVNPSLMLLICDGAAKEMIKGTKNLELSVGVGLQKVFIYKQSSLNALVIPLEEFINDSFGLAKSAMVGGISIDPEDKEEETKPSSQEQSSQGAELGGGSSSSSEEKNARIKFYNDIYYFKEGKYVNKMSDEKEILGVYLAETFSNSGDFKLEHINDGMLNDATIGLSFTNKSNKVNIRFENGKPILVLNIKIKDVQIVEILNKDKPSVNLYDEQDEELLKIVKEKFSEKIEEYITKAFNKAKTDNVDIFNISERAYQLDYKNWKKYQEENGENFLKDATIEVNVKIVNIN